MEKIVLDYLYKNYYHAGSKAREDVNRIAQDHGFRLFLIKTHSVKEISESHSSVIYQLFYRFRKFFVLLRSLFLIKRGTFVLLQYPLEPFDGKYTLFICRFLKFKKCHLVLLVHDVGLYRYHEMFDKTEIKIFNTASELIVHTPQMQKLFRENGIDRPCKLLWLFDYLTNEKVIDNTKSKYHNDYSIAFAGNLDKSAFLNQLFKVEFKGVQLHLYGNKPQYLTGYPNWINYLGRFSPENVTMLKEEWGLAWDGDSIECLHGPLGNYMRYNASHKISLYIAAGIPVILSKESSLAEYVEINKLGITISSLLELENKILNQDPEDLQLIRKNVAEKSKILRTGGMLGAVLEAIVQDFDKKQ